MKELAENLRTRIVLPTTKIVQLLGALCFSGMELVGVHTFNSLNLFENFL